MLSQIPEHCRRVGAVLRLNLARALRDDARQIREGLLAAPGLPELGAAPRVPVRLRRGFATWKASAQRCSSVSPRKLVMPVPSTPRVMVL